MVPFEITLFGKFAIRRDGAALDGFEAPRAQELFGYLLLHRGRPHPREALASTLWEYNDTAQARMYLRRTLWQLQQALAPHQREGEEPVLRVEREWVQLNPHAPLVLDVATFEAAYEEARGRPGRHLGHDQAQRLQAAAALYTSDLLANWYHDWCLFERQRLEQHYLALLDKLVDYCEAHRAYELGRDYGERILRIDRAREHTHRRLMRLRYLAGDRTGALRQYERCRTILDEELGVGPARATQTLYDEIRADGAAPAAEPAAPPASAAPPATLPERLDHVASLQQQIAGFQAHLQQEIDALQHAIRGLHSA